MDDVLKPILALLNNPLADLLISLGIGKDLATAISAAFVALILWQIAVWSKKFQARLKNNKAAKDLKPEFDYLTIKGYRDIFIPTRYSRISPNRYDNPHEVHKHNKPDELIPFMIKHSFNERVENEKFYLILGDSGMGKTAFMLNLYMAYYAPFNFQRKPQQQMKLFRFQPPDIENPVDILDRIKKITDEEAQNTILLLDGLDEDPYILSKAPNISDDEVFVNRLNRIASETRRFSDVVITCRTQYFPQEELQDYELNIRKPDRGFYKLNKYYLFPFSDGEVRKYLNKKYGRFKFWHWSKKTAADKLVKNSHKLMSRPMLLSYLDDLLLEEKEYQFSYQIYETLIKKWFRRESEKWKKTDERPQFIDSLQRFTRKTALQIYRNWESEGVLYLSKADALQIAQTHQIELKPEEVKGKSLLTCDPLLNWKFAHKSILEYFLAKECEKNWTFAANFNFKGMDMAKHFYQEMAPVLNATRFVAVKGGRFLMGSPANEKDAYESEKPQHEVMLSDFYIAKTLVTQQQWREIMGDNPSGFKHCDSCPVEQVSWEDAQTFIARLNEKTGLTFRLPCEAEWEYAARGGHKAPLGEGREMLHAGQYKYAGSDDLDAVGWYGDNAGDKTHPVATKQSNELGLYDMNGNVLEWCQDWFSENYYADCKKAGVVNDPRGPENGSYRVLRGGSWLSSAQRCRSAARGSNEPGYCISRIGFRLVFVP